MLQPDVAVLSNQNLFREGVVQLLHSQGIHRVTEFRSAAELLAVLGVSPPRLVLIDMDHTADDSFPLLREFRRRAPHMTVVVIGAARQSDAANGDFDGFMETPEADDQVLRAVASLALTSDLAPAPPIQLSPEALRQRKLWSSMTPRQREVLGFLSVGSDNLKIAAHLGISERAVKAHVSALLSLFSAENRTELAVLACRAGLRPPHRSQPEPLELATPRSA